MHSIADKQGNTALSLAAESGRKTAVKLLLNPAVDVNAKDQSLRTRLTKSRAAWSQRGSPTNARYGADVKAKEWPWTHSAASCLASGTRASCRVVASEEWPGSIK